MDRNSPTPRLFWSTILAFTGIINLTMARSVYLRQVELQSNMFRSTWSVVTLLCILLAGVSIWLMIRISRGDLSLFQSLDRIRFDSPIGRVVGVLIFVGIVFLIPYVKFSFKIGQEVKHPVYDPVLLLLIYYWMCCWLVLFATAAIKAALQMNWLGGFAAAMVLLGISYEALIRFNMVTDYPFSMGWSEGSRFYYASLFFSKLVYGQSYPLSTLHPTRYLLQSFPFLFPSLGLFAHRFWQYLLWIGLTAGASIAITKRTFASQEKAIRWLAAGWLFLFLLRVGVYYHLEVMVILPLLFLNTKKLWRSLAVVILASFWAGISRVNWFPMPAMLTITLYLLETPLTVAAYQRTSLKQLAEYLFHPVVWIVAGLASALLSQWAYVYVSGNAKNAEAFTSSFTSDLLWYRLWPNENFPLGVIPAILIISGPLLAIIILAAQQWKSLHPIRWLGLIAMLIVMFTGSAVVSTKIGGGGDLHNMDTYAALVGLVAMYFLGSNVRVESGDSFLPIRPSPAIAVALVIPLLMLIPALEPYPTYQKGVNQQAHQQLVDVVNEISKQGPVLFINDRQAVALGEVDVPLVYDYEVVTLMEMAMSGNQAYLNRFYDDLANHRFAAIVSGRQNIIIKKVGVFSEENNVWNTRVSPYILCYYESSLTIEADSTRLEIYRPRTQTVDCSFANMIP